MKDEGAPSGDVGFPILDFGFWVGVWLIGLLADWLIGFFHPRFAYANRTSSLTDLPSCCFAHYRFRQGNGSPQWRVVAESGGTDIDTHLRKRVGARGRAHSGEVRLA